VRVVLDTNVLVAALLTHGTPPERLYSAWHAKQFVLCSCERQIEEINRVSRQKMAAKPEFAQWVNDRIPAGKVGQPEDVAAAVTYAARPAASLITGTSLLVDGGWTAQ
jgi:predicted nucleic acid-binding protein